MARKGIDAAADEGFPLMDELNELIEKERTLLNLKLLAQKNETESWKAKYDKLVDKVGSAVDDVEATVDQQLEAAATVEASTGPPPATFQDIQKLLIERTSSWILDLSDKTMLVSDFARLLKEVFGSRSSFAGVNTVNLKGCFLTDEFTVPLLSFMRSSRLQAIDLSSNELSEAFFLQLLGTLKDRRTTPQYMLFENNVPLSHTAKHFAAILDTLTEHTWGLTVSLRDFTDVALSSLPPKHSRAAARKELNYDYKETVKQPNLAHEFLRAFNAKLDPAGSGPLGKATTAAAVKKAMAQSKGAVLLGRQSGLHKMTTFGMKYCQLSKRTVALLETTLLHTAPTLTDLDLSFAYIGYPGAEVLQRVLAAPGCQIIRLALIGNAMGDAGIATFSTSLQAHPTLTFLDLRSNAMTNLGLNSLTQPLSSNHILSYLDLRGNEFSQEALLSLQGTLKNLGSHVHINWAHALPTPKPVVSMTQAPVFAAPQKVKAVGAVGKATKLFTIDLAAVLQNHVHLHGAPMALQWRWRPVPIGTYTTTGTVLTLPSVVSGGDVDGSDAPTKTLRSRTRKAAAAEANENAAFFSIGSTYAAYWEVRVMHNHQELFRRREPIAPTSGVTRNILQRNPEWVASSTILENVHAKGTVEVYAVCLDASASAPAGDSSKAKAVKKFVAFEGAALMLSDIPSRAAYPLGGDAADLQSEDNEVVGRTQADSAGLQSLYPDLVGFKIARRLRWTHGTRSQAKLTWQAKLRSGGAEAGSAGKPTGNLIGEDYPPNHHSLGYRWIVVVCAPEGGARTVADGVCTASMGGAADLTAAAPSDKLRAWLWHDCTAQLTGLQADDTVLLAVKAISEQPNYPAAVLHRCAVAVKDVCLSVSVRESTKVGAQAENDEDDLETEGSVHHRLGEDLACDVAAAALFAVHDDVNLYFPM